MATADFDPRDKYYKPAGFGNPPAPHHKYIEYGRKPWQYRIGGAAITSFEDIKPYPRVCAHRGYNKIAPENSLPAYAAAIAMGADEIELDLWPTADGEIVCCHDASLERVSTGEGLVYEKTLSQLREYDFGIKFGKEYEGLAIPRLEDILAKFSGQAIMNIHIKPLPRYAEYPSEIMERIISLIRKYDARRHCYLMIERDADIPRFKALAPEIPVCVGHDSERPYEIVERAIALGADKVQLYKPYFNQAMVDLAREKGIICNLFFADEPDEAIRYLEMGVDTILTNNFNAVSRAVTEWKNTKKEKNREKHKLQGIS